MFKLVSDEKKDFDIGVTPLRYWIQRIFKFEGIRLMEFCCIFITWFKNDSLFIEWAWRKAVA
jgi:hypothetical protein